jgi:DNA polymerase III subunit alpha
MPFTHLHVHSHFTLLESTIRIPALVKRVKEMGMEAVALTDRGNLFGAYEFMAAAKEHGIKGIIGCQLNVAPLGLKEKTRDMHQLVVLAKDEAGYVNLAKLVSRGWTEGFYFEPRIDLETLSRHAAGLVCLTGAGKDGFINRHLLAGANDEARRQLGLLGEVFGKDLFIEVTDHGNEGPVSALAGCVALSRAASVPLVATNWAHYLDPDASMTHDVQLAIQKATTIADSRRKRMPSAEYYLKSPDAMAALFAELPEALANTGLIAEMCAKSGMPIGSYHLPTFACPDGKSEDEHLRHLCEIGLRQRYGDDPAPELRPRLEFEFDTIVRMGFAAYFLIVADFINWAKNRGIPVGPGRGSAAGSLVSYCLGITDICPLRYGLLFERFLNPGRKSMPDIDIDFCKDRRGEVIDYVATKYGHDAVVQIMTLGTMKARMAIKDVARAYEWTPEEAQDLANLVPEDPSGKHTLAVCLGKKPLDKDKNLFEPVDGMVRRYENDERTHTVLDTALALEGLGRSLGVHACGIVVAPGAVSDYVPVCMVKGKPATQFNMSQVEKCGLLKMDFLGLKTMSILKKAADIATVADGVELDYGRAPLDDRRTFELLGQGDTLGVFQCESTGFRELIKMLKPDRFEDLIALVALYRPGPLMAGMHIQYCDRKHGREKVDYPHPVLERSLKETYGLYIYQEQVMNISRELCGFTPAEADDLRKAMGKKDLGVLKKLEEKFIEGAWNTNRFDRGKCKEMWEKILGFASYCFNKSHSACYGLIAYWTAYAKANHYAAFMTANLIYEMDNKDKMTRFVEELRAKDIPVLPPDVNQSGWEFTLVPRGESDAAIRFGFGGVKGVGEAAAEHIIAERAKVGAFPTLYDLCERIDTRVVNKRVVENLIKVGALDSLCENRKSLCEAVDRAFDRGSRLARTRAQNQETLFDSFERDVSFKRETQGYPEVDDFMRDERLAFEKELTGYWISSHPVAEHEAELAPFATATTRDLAALPNGAKVTIAAVVLGKRVIRTKTGRMMAILSLEDPFGRFEGVLFPGGNGRRAQMETGAFDKFAADCTDDVVALFTGSVERRERRARASPTATVDEAGDGAVAEDDGDGDAAEATEETPSIIINDVVAATMVSERLTREITIAVEIPRQGAVEIAATEALVKESPGQCPLRFVVRTSRSVVLTIMAGDRWRVHPTREMLARLTSIWGSSQVATLAAELAPALRVPA